MGAAAIVLQQCTFHAIDVFLIMVTTFPLNLEIVGQMVKKWKQLFETKDGGDHHVEFWILSLFDFMYVCCIKVAISLLN